MFRILGFVALLVWATALGSQALAQPTPAPPEWQDNGKSVYLQGEAAAKTVDQAAQLPATTSQKLDTNVVPSAHEKGLPVTGSSTRRLAPPSTLQSSDKKAGHRFVDFGIPTKSMYTIGSALAIVIGTFFLFVWVLRRSGRGAAGRRAILPQEAVSVLGRISLTGRQVAELLRVGNKLVLVALTPGGAETLTEVTDPAEVDRLMGLCQQHDRHSTTNAFEHVFQQLSREPADGGFYGADSLPTSISPAAAAYRSHRGERARA
jgi:flagellar biogenesis protein FliO